MREFGGKLGEKWNFKAEMCELFAISHIKSEFHIKFAIFSQFPLKIPQISSKFLLQSS